MKAKFKKYGGIGMLIWGFVFLFNPEIAVIDILPDFIGYSLICAGLVNLSDMYYQFADARRGFAKGIIISAAKLVSFVILIGLFSYSERPVGMLLFTFLFAVLELIFLIPAYRNLFEGFLYAAQRLNSNSALRYAYTDEKQKKLLDNCKSKGIVPKNLTQKAYKRAVTFIIIKNTLAVAPELTSLINNNQYAFIGLLRSFAVLICFVFGVFFLINTVRYFTLIKKDEIFISAIKEKYECEVLPKKHLFVSRRISAQLIAAAVSCILCINVYNEDINIVPGVLFFIGSLVFFAIKRDEGRFRKLGIIASVAGILTSGLEWVLWIIFFKNHFLGEVSKFPHAYWEYYTISGIAILNCILSLIIVIFLAMSVYDIASKHTGRPEYEGGVVVSNKVHKDDLFEYKKSMIIIAALFFISKLTYLFNIFASPFSINFWMIEMSPMIDTIASVIFAIYSYCILTTIKNHSKKCYSEY